MPVKKTESNHNAVFYCTFTCYNWFHLFEIIKFYDGIYNWFNILIKKGNKILGYVVMPNHVHFVIYFTMPDTILNKVVGTGKRFMAYDIIEGLTQQEQFALLETLASAVKGYDNKNNKLHEVFKPSFDHKLCYSYEFILNKSWSTYIIILLQNIGHLLMTGRCILIQLLRSMKPAFKEIP